MGRGGTMGRDKDAYQTRRRIIPYSLNTDSWTPNWDGAGLGAVFNVNLYSSFDERKVFFRNKGCNLDFNCIIFIKLLFKYCK